MTDNDFRKQILERLTARNARESAFHEIIINSELLEIICSIVLVFVFVRSCAVRSHSQWLNYSLPLNWLTDHRILERNHELKGENLALSVDNEKLRLGQGMGDSAAQARIQALEKRLLEKQEELTDMHKRKSDNQQMIIDLNVKVTELQKQFDAKHNRWTMMIIIGLRASLTRF